MDKKFEALDWLRSTLEWFLNKTTDDHCQVTLTRDEAIKFVEEHKVIEQALAELKTIREENPNEALECLKEIEKLCWSNYEQCITCYDYEEELSTIKRALLKVQVLEEKNNILLEQNDDLYDELLLGSKQYKELMEYTKLHDKILKIIREKCVDSINLGLVEHCVSYESYKLCSQNNIDENDNIEKEDLLTEDEFDTLKNYILVLKP